MARPIFGNPPDGADIFFIDQDGNKSTTPLKSFGWATRVEPFGSLCPESMDIIAIGKADQSKELGDVLRKSSPPQASSSGVSSGVLAMEVADGQIARREFKYALVAKCQKGDLHPIALEVWLTDFDFRTSPASEVRDMFNRRAGDCGGKTCD
jgi:hypothetical protein